MDPNATDIAVEGLNGMELGDKHLKVQRASIGVTQASGLEMGVNAMSMLAGTTSNDLEEGRVLQLLNMVTPEELIDNEDYAGMFFSFHFHHALPQSSAEETHTDSPPLQKSAKTSKKNARNTAKCLR